MVREGTEKMEWENNKQHWRYFRTYFLINFLTPTHLSSLNGINSYGRGIIVLPEAIESQTKAQCQVWIHPSLQVVHQGVPETFKPVQALAVALGRPPELESKVLWMETPQTVHGVKKPSSYWPDVPSLMDDIHSARRF